MIFNEHVVLEKHLNKQIGRLHSKHGWCERRRKSTRKGTYTQKGHQLEELTEKRNLFQTMYIQPN